MVSETEYPKIYSILFGEGLVNDAVSVIIYQSIPKIFDSKTRAFEFDLTVFGNLIYQFLSITFVSILVGFVVGLIHC
jgi:NhaP-type Na+/H+ or K+/H+ antiporter